MSNANLLNQNKRKNKVEYYTNEKAWDLIKEYIPKNKPIWSPFYNPKYIDSVRTQFKLMGMGFEVLPNKGDFFTYTHKNSVVVDNPPFNLKQQIIKKLVKEDIPFILMLPNNIFSTKYIKEYCKKSNDFQFIMPLNRIPFSTSEEKGTTIHTCFFCYKMNLKDRMVFVDWDSKNVKNEDNKERDELKIALDKAFNKVRALQNLHKSYKKSYANTLKELKLEKAKNLRLECNLKAREIAHKQEIEEFKKKHIDALSDSQYWQKQYDEVKEKLEIVEENNDGYIEEQYELNEKLGVAEQKIEHLEEHIEHISEVREEEAQELIEYQDKYDEILEENKELKLNHNKRFWKYLEKIYGFDNIPLKSCCVCMEDKKINEVFISQCNCKTTVCVDCADQIVAHSGNSACHFICPTCRDTEAL